MLLAAMNPCPCGYSGVSPYDDDSDPTTEPKSPCRCSAFEIKRYQGKVSGPILDRIDLVVRLSTLSSQERYSPPKYNQSILFKAKVLQARLAQLKRQHKLNYRLGTAEVFSPDNPLRFTPPALVWFQAETDKPGKYSTRKTVRLARIARTIADINGSYGICLSHVHCAVSFVDQTILSLGD
jgi:magnesium chelatase family protein